MKVIGYQPWMERAECRTEDPDLFYAPEGERAGPAKDSRHAAAKAVCARCPVLAECGEYIRSTETPSAPHGIWSGLTEDERSVLSGCMTPAERSRRRPSPPRQHGTATGYRQHRLHKEEPCPPCRLAFGDYQRSKRQQRGAS